MTNHHQQNNCVNTPKQGPEAAEVLEVRDHSALAASFEASRLKQLKPPASRRRALRLWQDGRQVWPATEARPQILVDRAISASAAQQAEPSNLARVKLFIPIAECRVTSRTANRWKRRSRSMTYPKASPELSARKCQRRLLNARAWIPVTPTPPLSSCLSAELVREEDFITFGRRNRNAAPSTTSARQVLQRLEWAKKTM